MIVDLKSHIPEHHRAACDRRFDSNSPDRDAMIEAGRLHPGTRAFTAEMWRSCKFWGKRALVAKREGRRAEWSDCRRYLQNCIDLWDCARRMERRTA